MDHGTYVPHVPWYVLGSLTRGGGENVPGIRGACATRNFTYLARGPCVTPPLIFYKLIDKYRQQTNWNNNVINISMHLISSVYKRDQLSCMCVEEIKNIKILIDCSSIFVSQEKNAARWPKYLQNGYLWKHMFCVHITSETQFSGVINCHIKEFTRHRVFKASIVDVRYTGLRGAF